MRLEDKLKELIERSTKIEEKQYDDNISFYTIYIERGLGRYDTTRVDIAHSQSIELHYWMYATHLIIASLEKIVVILISH